eukprot:GHVU01127621.1.p1 GENE.GHVU01127621.1~~GHVU01127621.1.p1  ORF type:complete len:165 (-),score=8.40 GHVU01127621.1:346-840(-)
MVSHHPDSSSQCRAGAVRAARISTGSESRDTTEFSSLTSKSSYSNLTPTVQQVLCWTPSGQTFQKIAVVSLSFVFHLSWFPHVCCHSLAKLAGSLSGVGIPGIELVPAKDGDTDDGVWHSRVGSGGAAAAHRIMPHREKKYTELWIGTGTTSFIIERPSKAERR